MVYARTGGKITDMCTTLGYKGNMKNDFVHYNADVDQQTKMKLEM